MTELTAADLKDYPSSYQSLRDVGDVLLGEDTARDLIEASTSGNNTALQTLLSQPQWVQTILEKQHVIYSGNHASNTVREVLAKPIANIERCLTVAAENGHATVISTLLACAAQHEIKISEIVTRSVINNTIGGGHATASKALALADPDIVNFSLAHGARPLYEAVRRDKPDIVAVLLELGADPSNSAVYPKADGSYRSSLMSHAASGTSARMTEMLLQRGASIAQTGALHTAARCSRIDTMRLLLQHGSSIDETLPDWHNWTPMHFAASRGQVDAMNMLEENGASTNITDANGKTAAQLLEERSTA